MIIDGCPPPKQLPKVSSMRSKDYSDEELIDIWRSWGIHFLDGVSIKTVANVIRALENCIGMNIKDKYVLISRLSGMSSINLMFLKLRLTIISYIYVIKRQFIAIKNQNIKRYVDIDNRLEWTLICMDLQGALNDIPINCNNNLLSNVECLLVRAWVKEESSLANIFEIEDQNIRLKENKSNIIFAKYFSDLLENCLKVNRIYSCGVLVGLAWRALFYIKANDFDQLDKMKVTLLTVWGAILLFSKNYLEAEKKYETALNYVNNSSKDHQYFGIYYVYLLIEHGYLLCETARLNSAHNMFKEAWSLCNTFSDTQHLHLRLLTGWGLVLFMLGQYDQSIERYQKAWESMRHHKNRNKMFEEKALLLCNWGGSLMQIGQLEQAQEKFDQAWHYFNILISDNYFLDRNRAILLMNWGVVYFNIGRLDQSLVKYELAWKYLVGSLVNLPVFDADRAKLLANWGNTYSKLGLYDQAHLKYQHAWHFYQDKLVGRNELDSERAKLLLNWGLVFYRLNQFDQALIEYQKAWNYYNGLLSERSELDPDRAQALMNMALSFDELNQFDQALINYEKSWELFQKELTTRKELDGERARLFTIWAGTCFKLGQFDLALEKFELAWAYFEGSLANRSDFDEGRAILLMNWGVLLSELGQFNLACDKFQQAWDFYTNSLLGRTELDFDKARLMNNWGGALMNLGLVEQSFTKCKQATIYYKESLRERKELDNDRAKLLTNLSGVLYKLGDLKQSHYLVQEAWKFYCSFKNRPEWDADRALLLMNWGIILSDLGLFDQSEIKYQEASNLLFGSLESRTELDNKRASLFINWGSLCLQAGNFDQAFAKHQQAWEIFNGPLANRHELDEGRALLLMNWGAMANEPEELEKGIGRFEQAWRIYSGSLSDRPELDGNRAMLLMNWGVNLIKLGRLEDGLSMYQQAWHYYQSPLLIGQQQLNPDRCLLLTNWLTAMGNHIDPKWAFQTSQLMAYMLELADWKDPSYSEGRISAYYAKYHSSWLLNTFNNKNYRLIPEILGAIQGRKIARLILNELDQSEFHAECPEQVKEFKRLRVKLRQITADMKVVSNLQKDTNSSKHSYGTFKDDQQSLVEIFRSKMDALAEEYKRTMEAYLTTRQEVMKLEDYQHLTAPYQRVNADKLQRYLMQGQALLILIDRSTIEHKATISLENNQPTNQFFAWLLFYNGESEQVDVSHAPITEFTQQLQAGNLLNYSRLSLMLRKGPDSGTIEHVHFKGWDWFAEQMRSTLWQPLEEHLSGIKELFVVTHGRFHQLPLTLGMTFNCKLYHYPGLPFFVHERSKEPDQETSRAHVSVCYTGSDLILAPHESKLLSEYLWNKINHQGEPLNTLPDNEGAENIPLASLYFSCHGGVSPDQPEFTHLKLCDDNRITFHEILRMPYRPKGVFIGACVAGQTHEDRDGDPLGPVTAFFIRGAEVVIACLTPVPDLYMPLLAYLTEYTAISQQQPLDQALATAKQHLVSWQTDSDYAHLAEGYREWLQPIITNWLEDDLAKDKIDQYDEGEQKSLLLDLAEKVLEKTRYQAIQNDLLNLLKQHGYSTALKDAVIEAIRSELSHQLMSPPPEIIELLTHSVRAFGKGTTYH